MLRAPDAVHKPASFIAWMLRLVSYQRGSREVALAGDTFNVLGIDRWHAGCSRPGTGSHSRHSAAVFVASYCRRTYTGASELSFVDAAMQVYF